MSSTRSTNLKFPITWKEFDGNREISGKIPNFWIQDVEKSHADDIIHQLINNFYRDEPFGRYGKIYENSNVLSNATITYEEILKDQVSIVCMTNGDNGVPIIAGFYCMEILSQAEGRETTGERLRLEGLLLHLLGGSPYAFLGAQEYIRDRGLYVLPEYRGQGIAVHLLESWPLICQTMKIHHGLGIFSSNYAQKAAKRAGLKEICTVDYEELRKVSISYAPLGIEKHKHVKVYGVFA